jgi:hypothetical protein
MIACKHALRIEGGNGRGIQCALGLHGGYPHISVCRRCDQYDGASRGAGDTVAKITRAIGIRKCGGCKRRQRKLNKLIRYKDGE